MSSKLMNLQHRHMIPQIHFQPSVGQWIQESMGFHECWVAKKKVRIHWNINFVKKKKKKLKKDC